MTFTIVAFCMPAAPKAFQGTWLMDTLVTLFRPQKQSSVDAHSRWGSNDHHASTSRSKYRKVDDDPIGLTTLPTRPMATITTSESKQRLHDQPIAEVGILRTTHVEVREEFVSNNPGTDQNGQVHPWAIDS